MAASKGNKKRPKYIQDIVNDINAQLRANYIKDEIMTCLYGCVITFSNGTCMKATISTSMGIR